VIAALLSVGCARVVTKTHSYPIYEMRCVQVGERRVPAQQTERAAPATAEPSAEEGDGATVEPVCEWRRYRVATAHYRYKKFENRGALRLAVTLGVAVASAFVLLIATDEL
jgi:hypothetical protein